MLATDDPALFLDAHSTPVIIDEIQKAPGLMEENFKILEQYKMPIATGLVIDTSDRVFPLNKDTYYCPVGMIGL